MSAPDQYSMTTTTQPENHQLTQEYGAGRGDLLSGTALAPMQAEMANAYNTQEDEYRKGDGYSATQDNSDMSALAPVPWSAKTGLLESLFGGPAHTGLLIKQTMKGCCCETANQFTVHDYQENYAEGSDPGEQKMLIAEREGWCLRILSHFAPGFRKAWFDTWLTPSGTEEDKGEDVTKRPIGFLTHEKGFTNGVSCWIIEGDSGPLRLPCCCNLPYLDTKFREPVQDPNSQFTGSMDPQMLGRTQYVCDLCLAVPKFDVWNSARTEVLYRIRPDTCMAGMCPKCICGGGKGRCCALPFLIRQPKEPYEPVPAEDGTDAHITNFYSGLAKECIKRQNYALKFPKDASAETRATLIGSTLLIEMLQFEQN